MWSLLDWPTSWQEEKFDSLVDLCQECEEVKSLWSLLSTYGFSLSDPSVILLFSNEEGGCFMDSDRKLDLSMIMFLVQAAAPHDVLLRKQWNLCIDLDHMS